MPVYKYRSVEDVEPLTGTPLDPDNLRRVIEWSAFCRRLHPTSRQPGVFRYRSLEEADAARSDAHAGWQANDEVG